MKRCFGYVRVSTARQGEGVSLDAQKEAILAFADKSNITITKWFEEKVTAAKSGRPTFNAMIKALLRGGAEGVAIHKIDRSARNFADWAKIGELSDAGIDVHFASESLDFRSRGGRLSADIQAVIAADYIRNLREETMKGIMGRLKQGLYPFKAPIGYLDNGGGKPKTLDPIRAPLIREAFDLYASGQHSLRSLRKELTGRGLRNESGGPLSKRGIETVLSNPFYCGVIRVRSTGDVFQGVHEPLVPVQLFDDVQAVKAGKSGKKVTRHNHTYRGLFRCLHCGGAMIPERQKGHVYYRCQTRSCETKCVREERLEAAIRRVLRRLRLSDENVAWLMDEITKWCEANKSIDAGAAARMQLGKIDDRLERLTDALIDSLIDRQTFNDRKERLLLERSRLAEAARQTDYEPGNVRGFLELIKSLAATYEIALPPEKRQITQLATSNRRVAGRNVCLEPSNWLRDAGEVLAGYVGDPHRPTSRNRPELTDQQVKRLIALPDVLPGGQIRVLYGPD